MGIYYHATFGAYVDSIEQNGILCKHDRGNDVFSYGGGERIEDEVFVSDDRFVAIDFCEAADNVSDDVYDSGIYVVELEIDDAELEPDYFVLVNEGDDNSASFIHHGSISPEAIVSVEPAYSS